VATATDKYTLESSDGSFKKTLTGKDDKKKRPHAVTLLFENLKGGATYTLTVDPGGKGAPYKLFEDVPFKQIID
jgi:hypothetical protein